VLIELIRAYDSLGARLPAYLEVPVFCAVAWLFSLGLVKAIRGTGILFLRTVLLGESRSPASTAPRLHNPRGHETEMSPRRGLVGRYPFLFGTLALRI